MKALLRRFVRSLGCDVSRTTAFGKNPFVDIRKLATAAPRLGFDVGANEGQTACELRRIFPEAKIYCFEPYEAAFRTLQQKLGGDPNLRSSGSRSVITKAKRRFTKMRRA